MKVTINLFCEMFYHAFFIYLLQITYIFCPWSHTQTFNLRPKIIKKKIYEYYYVESYYLIKEIK